ncbi:helix-turn-helix domain-containing protein [Candidatus Poribacteria bacterium]|nr:helix-turn-helix domain-containing protein [Candidatus Poribacteria bacterium]
MDTLERYELIRPILNREKTPKAVHQETGIPLSTIYWYLKRFREDGIEGLADQSHAIHSHPKWLTEADKDQVVDFKRQHPHLTTRQIATALSEAGILEIHETTVAKILKARGFSPPFFSTNPLS